MMDAGDVVLWSRKHGYQSYINPYRYNIYLFRTSYNNILNRNMVVYACDILQ